MILADTRRGSRGTGGRFGPGSRPDFLVVVSLSYTSQMVLALGRSAAEKIVGSRRFLRLALNERFENWKKSVLAKYGADVCYRIIVLGALSTGFRSDNCFVFQSVKEYDFGRSVLGYIEVDGHDVRLKAI